MDIFGTHILDFLFDKHLAETITVITAVLLATFKLITYFISNHRKNKLPIVLQEKLKEASKYYILPDWSENDQSHHDPDEAINYSRKKSLIKHIEYSFKTGSSIKRIVVLAGSGMGKTALLYNLYKRHINKYLSSYKMILIELGTENSFKRILEIEDPENTVLLLDALDENIEALLNYSETIENINKITQPFYRVVITCRMQFFEHRNDVPKLLSYSGGVASAGDVASKFSEIVYVAPLNDRQVSWFLIRKYILSINDSSFSQYKKAKLLAKHVPDLIVRPMLLTYMDYILGRPEQHEYIYQIYESMIKGWLERRKSDELDPNYDDALKFMYILAINLVKNYSTRKGYHISKNEAIELAHSYNITLEDWQITGRSLLSVDVNNHYKFSHLAFMEVLVARGIRSLDAIGEWTPTPQTEQFLKEMVHSESLKPRSQLCHLDLSGISIKGSDLEGSDMTDTNLSNAELIDVNFKDTNLTRANLQFEDLTSSNIEGTNFTEANLRGANFSKNKLSNINFQQSDLTGANLSFCIINDANANHANFFGCDLSGTVFNNCTLKDSNFSRIRIEQDENGELIKPELTDTDITGAIFPNDWESIFQGNWKGNPIIDKESCDIYEYYKNK